MKLKTLMIIKAVVCLFLGLPIVIYPEFVYGLFGITLTVGGALAAREYGASLLGNFTITWLARDSAESQARHAIIWGLFIYDAVALVAMVAMLLSGDFSILAWGIPLIYLFFTIGFGYFALKPPKVK